MNRGINEGFYPRDIYSGYCIYFPNLQIPAYISYLPLLLYCRCILQSLQGGFSFLADVLFIIPNWWKQNDIHILFQELDKLLECKWWENCEFAKFDWRASARAHLLREIYFFEGGRYSLFKALNNRSNYVNLILFKAYAGCLKKLHQQFLSHVFFAYLRLMYIDYSK